MRDEKDPGTIELALTKKRGRPSLYGEAMTPGERAKRYRVMQARKATRDQTSATVSQLAQDLRESITEGDKSWAEKTLAELAKRIDAMGA